MTLDDFWKLPPQLLTDAQRITRMKQQWKDFVLDTNGYPEPFNNNLESPEVIRKHYAQRRAYIEQLMAEPDRSQDSKMRLEFWWFWSVRLERILLSGKGYEYV